MSAAPAPSAPHTHFEDIQALLIGTLMVALGVILFRAAGILTGGTAGVAFLLHYASGLPFGAIFFIVNIPFYVLAWRGMGRAFTFKTFAAVALMSGFVEWLPRLIDIERIDPLFAAVAGGLLVGNGLLILIRHRASLGGLGVLAVFLQERRGWRAGHIQLAMDALIFAVALGMVPAPAVLLSALGSAALNLVIAVNHRHGRYMGF